MFRSPPTSSRRNGREGLCRAAVFVLFLAALLLTWSGWRFFADEEVMLAVTRAVVLDRTVMMSVPGSSGRGRSPFGLGQSLLFAPAVVAARTFRPPGGMTPQGLEVLLASLTNPVVVALLGTLLYAAARAFGLGVARALLFACLGVFGTPFWSLTQFQMSEPVTALCLTGAALALTGAGTPRRDALAGALWGFAVLARPVELVIPPALLACALFAAYFTPGPASSRRLVARAGAAALGAAPCLAAFAAYNYARYGSPLFAGYHHANAPNILYSARLGIGKGIAIFLWSGKQGLVWFAPVAVLGLLLCPVLVRRRQAIGVAALLAFAVQLLIHARSGVLYGGPLWGPRYLMPVIPLVLFGLLPALESALGAILVSAVGAASVAINAIGVLHKTFDTFRHGDAEDVVRSQLARLSPADLRLPSMRPTSGTFWPTFTTFGACLVVAIGLSSLALAYGSGRLRARHAILWVIAPLLFAGIRERALPYRVLPPRELSPSRSTPVDLAAAVGIRGKVRAESGGIVLGSHGRAGLTVHLSRGLHRFRARLEGDGEEGYTLWLMADEIASGTVAASAADGVQSRPVRVRHGGDFNLVLVRDDSPAAARPGGSLVCRSIAIETISAGGL